MRALHSILNTALPFFALIFCGYGAGRLRLLEETAAAGVNTFVFYIKSNGELDKLYREYWKIPLPANMPTF